MRLYYVVIFFIAIVAVSCAPVNTKLMYNPQTGDVKECKRDPWKNWTWEEQAVLRKCAVEYKGLGYQETSDISNAKKNSSGTASKSLSEKLKELKSAYDDGLINEQEYNEKRKKYIDEF